MNKIKELPTLTITIPVLNEEKTLVEKIKILQLYGEKHLSKKITLSIIIADNGSDDKTQELGELLSSKHKNINFIRIKKKGVGLALKTSWKKYESEIMGYMDLDLATDLSHIEEAIEEIITHEYEIVSGSRLLKGSKVTGRKLIRTCTSRMFNKTIQILFNIKFTDGMCGFKFFKREILKEFKGVNSVNSDNWFFATEFLILADNLNLKIKDLPIRWTDDNSSKVKILRLSLQYLREMIILKIRLQLKK